MTASGCWQLLVAAIVVYELGNCLKNHQGASGENTDADDRQKQAQDQGAVPLNLRLRPRGNCKCSARFPIRVGPLGCSPRV